MGGQVMRPVLRRFPHADPKVLHAPGDCGYCDAKPIWQALRLAWNVPFQPKAEPGERGK